MKRLFGVIIAVATVGFAVLYISLSPVIRLSTDSQDKVQIIAATALGAAAFMTAVFALFFWASIGKAASWRLLKHGTKHYVLGRTDHRGKTYLPIFKRSRFGWHGIVYFAFDTTLQKEVDAGTTFVIYPDSECHLLEDGGERDENVIVLYADDLARTSSKNVRRRKLAVCYSQTT